MTSPPKSEEERAQAKRDSKNSYYERNAEVIRAKASARYHRKKEEHLETVAENTVLRSENVKLRSENAKLRSAYNELEKLNETLTQDGGRVKMIASLMDVEDEIEHVLMHLRSIYTLRTVSKKEEAASNRKPLPLDIFGYSIGDADPDEEEEDDNGGPFLVVPDSDEDDIPNEDDGPVAGPSNG